jgi:hypothetical protein
MQSLTGYHEKLVSLSSELVNHGWGECELKVVSLKDNTVRVEINCGKGFVFFIKKEITIDENKLL